MLQNTLCSFVANAYLCMSEMCYEKVQKYVLHASWYSMQSSFYICSICAKHAYTTCFVLLSTYIES